MGAVKLNVSLVLEYDFDKELINKKNDKKYEF
jgi:hypothetical protein